MITRRDLMAGTGSIFAARITEGLWRDGDTAALLHIDVCKSIGTLPRFWEKP